MEPNKKQKTLLQVWKKKEETKSESMTMKKKTEEKFTSKPEVLIIDESDDDLLPNLPSDEEEMLKLALELSMKKCKSDNDGLPNVPSDEEEMFKLALELSKKEYEESQKYNPDLLVKANSSSENDNISFHEDLMNLPSTSKTVIEIPKQVPREILPGFDLDAGRTWIYPTNYTYREYQFNISHAALYKNTMVVLPTGLGKTFIAAVIMYNFYRWYPQGKVVFMAPTRPLVNQQIEACFKIMGIPQTDTEVMLGCDAPDKRRLKWKNKRVFFLTPQVISNDISRGVCPVRDIKCLVVDEAHKAQGNHSYCEVIKGLTISGNNQFRVIGLSATPGVDLEAVRLVLENLLISHVELRSDDSPDVVPYTHVRTVRKIVVKLDQEILTVKEKFLKVLKYVLVRLERKNAIGKNVNPETLTQFGILKLREAFHKNPQSNFPKHLLNVIQLEFLVCISLYHAYELLCLHGTRTFYKYMKGNVSQDHSHDRVTKFLENNEDFHELFSLLKEKHEATVVKGNFPYGHPKLKKLEELVLEHFRKAQIDGDIQSTRVMIFSNYRESVEEIVEVLKQHEPLVRAMAFIGQNSKNSKGISQKVQLQVVDNFRKGGYNTLVSTCVGEEGLDIGEIDLIICYDAHKSPIRLVQRIGRTGRKRDGMVVSLVTEGKEDQKYSQGQYKKRSIDSALTSNAIQKFLNPNSFRMVPLGIVPVCQKMHMTVKSYEPKNLKKMANKSAVASASKSSNITNMFDKQNTANKHKIESAFLTDDEHAEWLDKFKIPEENIHLLPKSSILSLLNNEDENDDSNTRPELSLSKWTSWQTTLQPTFLSGHSKDTKVLVEILFHIQHIIGFPEDDPSPDYMKYLDMKDVLQPGGGKRKHSTIPSEDEREVKKFKKRRKILALDSSDEDDFAPNEHTKVKDNSIIDIIQKGNPKYEVPMELTEPQVENNSNIDGTNHYQKTLLRSPPVLDFDFDIPFSPVDSRKFDELFGCKIDASVDPDSDDGYKSDDTRFSFLNFTKIKPFSNIRETLMKSNLDLSNTDSLDNTSILPKNDIISNIANEKIVIEGSKIVFDTEFTNTSLVFPTSDNISNRVDEKNVIKGSNTIYDTEAMDKINEKSKTVGRKTVFDTKGSRTVFDNEGSKTVFDIEGSKTVFDTDFTNRSSMFPRDDIIPNIADEITAIKGRKTVFDTESTDKKNEESKIVGRKIVFGNKSMDKSIVFPRNDIISNIADEKTEIKGNKAVFDLEDSDSDLDLSWENKSAKKAESITCSYLKKNRVIEKSKISIPVFDLEGSDFDLSSDGDDVKMAEASIKNEVTDKKNEELKIVGRKIVYGNKSMDKSIVFPRNDIISNIADEKTEIKGNKAVFDLEDSDLDLSWENKSAKKAESITCSYLKKNRVIEKSKISIPVFDLEGSDFDLSSDGDDVKMAEASIKNEVTDKKECSTNDVNKEVCENDPLNESFDIFDDENEDFYKICDEYEKKIKNFDNKNLNKSDGEIFVVGEFLATDVNAKKYGQISSTSTPKVTKSQSFTKNPSISVPLKNSYINADEQCVTKVPNLKNNLFNCSINNNSVRNEELFGLTQLINYVNEPSTIGETITNSKKFQISKTNQNSDKPTEISKNKTPNFDLDFDLSEAFALTPEEHFTLNEKSPSRNWNERTTDEKESPILLKRRKLACVIKDDDELLSQKPAGKIHDQKSEVQPHNSKTSKRSKNSKGNPIGAKKYLLLEADVSGEHSNDEDVSLVDSSYDESFLNDGDESVSSTPSIKNVYMQSVKSPLFGGNKFKLQFNPKNCDTNIFSQAVETSASDYEEDSFCIRNSDDESGNFKAEEISPVKKFQLSKNGSRKRILATISSSDDDKPSNKRSSTTSNTWLSKPECLSRSKINETVRNPIEDLRSNKPSCSNNPARFYNPANASSIAESLKMNEQGFNEKLVVFVDSRELAPSRLIISTLRDVKGFHVEVCQLKIANYVVSSRVGVYRVPTVDFFNGANKDKMELTLRTMLDYFENSFLVLEIPKDSKLNSLTSTTKRSVRTAYADSFLYKVFNTDIKVLYSGSQAESAQLIADIANYEKGKKFHIGHRLIANLTKEKEERLHFLVNLPYVNYAAAINLMANFQNISQFLNCLAEEIAEKGRMPLKIVKKLLHFIKEDYVKA